jgi:hypothetical protein
MPPLNEATAHERIDAIHTRLIAVEGWMEAVKLQMMDVGNEVKANTRLTEDIHSNTHELIETMADLKVLGRWGKRAAIGAKYLTYIGGVIAAAWAFLAHK